MNNFKAEGQYNSLTPDDPNDLFLRHKPLGTLYTPDIIRRMELRNRSTVNVSGPDFVNQFFDECALAIDEGYNVITDLFKSQISIQGVVDASMLGRTISSDNVNVRVNFEMGKLFNNFGKNRSIDIGKNPATAGPMVQRVRNPLNQLPNQLTIGSMVLIEGLNISVRGSKEDEVGIFYENLNDGTVLRIPMESIFPNTPTKLQHVLPTGITPGEYKVWVATQSGANSKQFSENVRTGEFNQIVTVS